RLDPKLLKDDNAQAAPDADSSAGAITELQDETEAQFQSAYKRLRRVIPAFAAYSLVLLIHGGAGAAAYFMFPGTPYYFGAGGSLIVVFAIMMGVYSSRANKAYAAAVEILGKVSEICALIEKQKDVLEEHLTQQVLTAEGEKV